MAHDPYIMMRKLLAKHGRTLTAAAKLQESVTALVAAGKPIPFGFFKSAVLGGLFQLWCTGDEQGPVLSGYTPALLDVQLDMPGFCEALPPDWLSQKKNGIRLPNFEAQNGPTAKARILTAQRVREHRRRLEEASCNASGNGDVTPDGYPPNQPQPIQEKPKEKQPPPTFDDARAVSGYALEVLGVKLQKPVTAEVLLVDFGLAGVVETLEHLASRVPSRRFNGIESPPAFIRSLCAKALKKPLSREGFDHPTFYAWRAQAEARVQKVGQGV